METVTFLAVHCFVLQWNSCLIAGSGTIAENGMVLFFQRQRQITKCEDVTRTCRSEDWDWDWGKHFFQCAQCVGLRAATALLRAHAIGCPVLFKLLWHVSLHLQEGDTGTMAELLSPIGVHNTSVSAT